MTQTDTIVQFFVNYLLNLLKYSHFKNEHQRGTFMFYFTCVCIVFIDCILIKQGKINGCNLMPIQPECTIYTVAFLFDRACSFHFLNCLFFEAIQLVAILFFCQDDYYDPFYSIHLLFCLIPFPVTRYGKTVK